MRRAKGRVSGLSFAPLCVLVALLSASCAEELLPTEPEGAYMLWRQALLEGDEDAAYSYLDEETHKIFDQRVEVLRAMEKDIQRYLPQVDQKLARQQTGVVLLKQGKIDDGAGLFRALFTTEGLEVTPEIEVGTEISEIEINEAGDEAAVVAYAGQQFLLRKEGDGVWRIASWRSMCIERTLWILDNRSALEQTVQDLINEEKEEMNAVIKFLLAEEKRRKAQAEAPEK